MKTADASPAPNSTTPPKLYTLSKGRADMFRFTIDQLEIDPDFNEREEYGNLQELAADLEVNGVIEPFKVRKEKNGSRIFMINGHRRHRAITTILIPKGRWAADQTIPCLSEKPGTTVVDRLFMQISCNSGKPYTFLEDARLYQRILREDSSLKAAEIARRTGKTKQAISDSLRLVNEGSPGLLEEVKNGTIAASTALVIIKQAGNDPEAQGALYLQALEAAKAAGREHVMPKDIPVPDPYEGLAFSLAKPARGSFLSIGSAESGQDLFCNRALFLSGLPAGMDLAIGWDWREDGKWVVGHLFRADKAKKTAYCVAKLNGAVFPDLREALVSNLSLGASFLKWDADMHAEMEKRMLAALPAKELRNPKMPAENTEEPAKYRFWTVTGDGENGGPYTWNENDVCTNATTITLTSPKAPVVKLSLLSAHDPETNLWHTGYDYELKPHNSGGGLPNKGHEGHPTYLGSVWQEWLSLKSHYLQSVKPLDLMAWELELRTLCGLDPEESSSSDHSAPITDDSAALPRFSLYVISDSPEEALEDGTYHETERLVLLNPPQDIELLHLLSALDAKGNPCYGYRFNDITRLPNPSDENSAGTNADEGLPAMIRAIAAFASPFAEADGLEQQIRDALHDALCRYYPENGHPEEPEQIAFVAIAEPQAATPTGYEAIVNAPSSNRDGSMGGGGTGFVTPEKGMQKVNQVLEEVADKPGVKPDRVTAVEIALRILTGESTPSALKDFLLGKS